jgi:hypothetical protein
LACCQNTSMRTPNTRQLRESPRNHQRGISDNGPAIAQTTPTNTAPRPENGTITPYFIGSKAKIIKNTPTAEYVPDIRRTAYMNCGESGSDSIPKNLVMDSHAETGKNIPNTDSRHAKPAIHRQIFNARILYPFQSTVNFLLFVFDGLVQFRDSKLQLFYRNVFA